MTVDRRDRGAADALGLVVLVVPMMAFAVLVFYLGRNVDAQAQVRSAAESAAQAAALERDVAAGAAAARSTAQAMLDREICPGVFENPGGAVDVSFRPTAIGGIADELVEVTITCDVSNDDVRGIGAPDSDRVEARAFATIDRFRAGG